MPKIIFLIFFLNSILYLANILGGFDFECFYQKKSYFEKNAYFRTKISFSSRTESFFSFYVIFIITRKFLTKVIKKNTPSHLLFFWRNFLKNRG
jgi:hypothetical protein